MQRLSSFDRRSRSSTTPPQQGLQQAIVRALQLRHADVLRHLGAQRSHAEFASVLATLPTRQRDDALSLLAPCQRERVLTHLPRPLQKQWHGTCPTSIPRRTRCMEWLHSLYRSLRQNKESC